MIPTHGAARMPNFEWFDSIASLARWVTSLMRAAPGQVKNPRPFRNRKVDKI